MDGFSSDLPICLEEVSVTGRNVTILDCVTLQIETGPPTILIGPNGSGKTSLLRTAMGLLTPSQGRVTWGGFAKSPPIRRAIVFQRPAMLRRTAAGNLRYALRVAHVPRVAHERRIKDLLELVSLQGLGGRPARRLSGGEQQRLALARALATDPEVLFLDEPTASLDPTSTKAIEDVIRATAAGGIKIIMSTHDMSEARRIGGEIVLLHRGRLVESAQAAQFFNSPKTAEARSFIAGDLLV